MVYTCEYCGKSFNTNSGLYSHKKQKHEPPALVLVDHPDHRPTTERPLSPTDNNPGPSMQQPLPPIPSSDSEMSVDSLSSTDSEISTDLVPVYRKRKNTRDGDDNLQPKKRKESYILPTAKKKSADDYKKLYFKCLKESRKLKSNSEKLEHKYKRLQRNYEEEMNEIKKTLSKNVKDIEAKHVERVNQITEEYNLFVTRNEEKYESERVACERKIKELNEYIRNLKENEYDHFNPLSEILFKCSTIEEINTIRELIKRQRIDEVLKNHMGTLQNILLGLTVGVIPICNPQRSIITDKQRKLINDIQDTSPSRARQKILNNRSEFSRLWSIVDDSLKLACETYNRYGSRDENSD